MNNGCLLESVTHQSLSLLTAIMSPKHKKYLNDVSLRWQVFGPTGGVGSLAGKGGSRGASPGLLQTGGPAKVSFVCLSAVCLTCHNLRGVRLVELTCTVALMLLILHALQRMPCD